MKRVILILAVLMVTLVLTMPAAATGDSQANWQAQFFNDCCLTDPPDVTTTFGRIDFTWSNGSPVAGINADNFSARFNASVYFPRGTYRFYLQADDVARLSIDLQPIISTIGGGQTSSELTADRFLDGIYNLQIDYVERTGDAYLRVRWENLSGTPTTAGGTTATVLVATLNVRSEPSLNGAILTHVRQGQTFGVIARSADNNWVQINAGGVVGWVSAGLVRFSGQQPAPQPAPQPQPGTPTEFSVTTLANLRLRSAPVISNNTITTIPAGGTGRVLGRNATTGWLKVDFSGQVGWVSIRYVRVSPPLRIDAVPVLTQ
jgi:uncharacterized protein YraI